MSSDKALYKAQLLDHFKKPRNKVSGDLLHMDIIRRGSIPRCGDDIELGFAITNMRIERIEFRGRGCSVCIASASMMTEATKGQNIEDVNALTKHMKAWIAGEIEEIPSGLEALDAVRHHPVRKKCLMLSWEALADGLQEHMQNAEQSPHAK